MSCKFQSKNIAPIPTLAQLNNAVARARKNLYGPEIFTMDDLLEYAQKNSMLPEDENQPFLFVSELVYKPRKFVYAWTTKKLLRLCSSQRFLQVNFGVRVFPLEKSINTTQGQGRI